MFDHKVKENHVLRPVRRLTIPRSGEPGCLNEVLRQLDAMILPRKEDHLIDFHHSLFKLQRKMARKRARITLNKTRVGMWGEERRAASELHHRITRMTKQPRSTLLDQDMAFPTSSVQWAERVLWPCESRLTDIYPRMGLRQHANVEYVYPIGGSSRSSPSRTFASCASNVCISTSIPNKACRRCCRLFLG